MLNLAEIRLSDAGELDWHRSIVTLRAPVDLFETADGEALFDDAVERAALEAVEMESKPYRDRNPLLDRPFSEAIHLQLVMDAIEWPFENVSASRYSAGEYGVWYGADSLLASVHETVQHFRIRELEAYAVPDGTREIRQQRRVHLVACAGHVADLRPLVNRHAQIVDPDDYAYCQTLGARLRSGGLPGLRSQSVRFSDGEVLAVFDRATLSNPRNLCYLDYVLDVETGIVRVEREPGRTWRRLAP